ncbi:MAG: hypothetical protein QGF87_08085 [Woeseiaceae bacterium]|nr:hypothetical protein [Woeseiaceae bacterium]
MKRPGLFRAATLQQERGDKMVTSPAARAAILAILLSLVSACSPPPAEERDAAAELADFKAAIRAKYDMKEQAFRDNDPEPILTRFYSDDAISTDNEGATKTGRDELRPVYEEVIGAFVEIESYKTVVNGAAGWDWVNFHVSFPPEANMEPFTFKMLFLWERMNGEWWSQGEMYVLGEFDIP